MPDSPTVVDRSAWLEARLDHLEAEKAFTRQRDELSRRRRELPWLEITEDYRFTGPEGEVTLLDLFDGRGQLLVYHFMREHQVSARVIFMTGYSHDELGELLAADPDTAVLSKPFPMQELKSSVENMLA